MGLVDTHCHIHSTGYKLPPDEVIAAAKAGNVDGLICVGTDAEDSRRAVEFATGRDGCWASIGLHPHDAKLGRPALAKLVALVEADKVVAIGECGLDYFYSYSPKTEQTESLRWQMELAAERGLPVIFHVREAFDDFWKIYDDYSSIQGVVHSFSSGPREMEQILNRGLSVGLNGIMTFSRNVDQLAAAAAVPLDSLLLETDSPFLTPRPYRGKVNQPKYVGLIAQFLAQLRQEEVPAIEAATTANAVKLFGLKLN